ncbi:DUF445 family protein [Polaromonas sp. C04]|uniref:DUF445 domain-containing protein n=1 Tax=Polaromonas sp. C04 TaxID=1945857 RepID=UPI0009874C76|nr:DUF445 family protein [Polaromonas sp. C04]OOG50437.1 hypothetical protein B0E49_16985 [Polaromonas sp. C04]
MDKPAELARSKRQALGLLLLVTAVFVTTSWLPRSLGVDIVKAMAEAAMVGAMADWFAVVALFRRIPIPFIARHTAIIPRNKDRIGENLAVFVRDKFLDPPSLVTLMRRHDPVALVAQWLTAPSHAGLLGRQAVRLLSAALDMVEDAQVERFIKRAARALIGQMDLPGSMATVLAALTQNGRHQALLDGALAHLTQLLQEPPSRSLIAQAIVQWVKREHPHTEKVLPTAWLGEQGAGMAAHALESLLADVAHNPRHQLREKFDAAVQQLIDRLRTDPEFARKGEEIRRYLQHDATLGTYVQGQWQGMRAALKRDLANEKSLVARNAGAMGRWLGQSLAQDADLRASLNQRLEDWVHTLAPEVSQFVAQHIQDTVQRWDAQEMSHLIELNIGKDLQHIRINGTLVGGVIGLVLFALSHLPELVRALRG